MTRGSLDFISIGSNRSQYVRCLHSLNRGGEGGGNVGTSTAVRLIKRDFTVHSNGRFRKNNFALSDIRRRNFPEVCEFVNLSRT